MWTGVRLLLAALALAGAGACRVETTVGLTLGADGTGEVVVEAVLDREAVRRVGDVGEEIRTADLRAAGWVVEEPEQLDDGGARLLIRRPFSDLAAAEAALRSLATGGGPFGTVEIDQRRGFWSTTTTFSATVDLTGGLASLSDPQLAEALGGQPLGLPTEDLERRLGSPLDRVFRLQVSVRLPGRLRSNAPERADGSARWTPELGQAVDLEASSRAVNRPRIVLASLAATSALAALALGAGQAATGRRRPRPRPHQEASAEDGPATGGDPGPGP